MSFRQLTRIRYSGSVELQKVLKDLNTHYWASMLLLMCQRYIYDIQQDPSKLDFISLLKTYL